MKRTQHEPERAEQMRMEAFAGMTRLEMQDTWIWTAMKRLERDKYIESQPYSRFIENQRFELRLTQKFFDEYNGDDKDKINT